MLQSFSLRCQGVVLVMASFLTLAALAGADDWPAWRGPRGDSTSQDVGLPLTWSAEQGIAWKTALPEWGTSTPAIWGDAIFVTTQHEDELLVLKLDRLSGKIEWTQKVGEASTPRTGPKREKQKFHQLHNLASPSPVANADLVVAHFGNGDLAAYDYGGGLLWRRNLQDDFGTYTIWWGHANSPVLFRDTVISVCMQDSLSDVTEKHAGSYLVAHDLQTGRQRWKSERMTGAPAEEGDAYTTPILVEVDGKKQLIVMGANQLDAYDPATGKQLWFLPGLVGGRTVTGPTPGDGTVFVTRGMRGALLAVKLGGEGKLSTSDILWKHEKGTPDSPCSVRWKETLFTVTDDGIARAFDATNGHLHWTERLKGDFKASPVAAEGRVYFLNTKGVCTVIAATKRFEKLAENELPDSTLASPAVAGGQLFIRGRQALYCIGPKQASPK
jgi:outer membrane protein assembly factor BamB